jgi:DNA polymerase-3 subunit alpha
MSKKKEDVMRRERDCFINGVTENGVKTVPGCVANGVPRGVADEVFDQMLKFAEYAFNKSHAAAYAVVAYQTAWLKTYYPTEFMAALMTSVMGKDIGQIGVFVRNSEEMGIKVLPPDILESGKNFKALNGEIRYGLLCVKNVGAQAVDAIIKARTEAESAGRPWTSLTDMIKSVDLSTMSRKSVESLIRAGAFDRFQSNRAKYIAVFDMLTERVKREREMVGRDQISMFGGDSADIMRDAEIDIRLPDVSDFTKLEKMNMEKDILGIYLSGHPLDEHEDVIEQIAGEDATYVSGKAFYAAQTVTDAPEGLTDEDAGVPGGGYASVGLRDGMTVCFIGVISNKQTNFTKKGDLYARARVEDRYGWADILVWPEPLAASGGAVENDTIVVVRGKLQLKEDAAPTILVFKITSIDVAENWYAARAKKADAEARAVLEAGEAHAAGA